MKSAWISPFYYTFFIFWCKIFLVNICTFFKLWSQTRKNGSKNGKPFYYELLLEFSYGTINGLVLTKLLKSLYPNPYLNADRIQHFMSMPIRSGCRSGSRSRVLMTKNNEKITAEKKLNLQFISIFLGHFCLPGSGSGSSRQNQNLQRSKRIRIQIKIRIRNTDSSVVFWSQPKFWSFTSRSRSASVDRIYNPAHMSGYLHVRG